MAHAAHSTRVSTRASSSQKRPELFLHKASGHWCKTIKGRRHYFGKDERQALEQWHKQKDDLLAGQSPKREEVVTLAFACNYMLTRKDRLVESGDLSTRQFNDLRTMCQYLCDQLGSNRSVQSLTPDDFGKLREKMTKRWAPSGLIQRINNIRQVFRFAYRNGIIEREVRFGDQFSPPTKRQRRMARNAKGERMFEPAEILAMLEKAPTPHMKAFVLLGVNTGIGNSDLSRMEPRHVNLESGWLDYPRGKTGIRRRAKLWDETCQAIRDAVATQKESKTHGHLLFRTKYGNAWSNPETTACGLSREFIKLAKVVGAYSTGKGFYTLRHVAETIGGECRDQVAVDVVMGHNAGHISGEYRERISDERLEAVADTIYAWLYRSKQGKPR